MNRTVTFMAAAFACSSAGLAYGGGPLQLGGSAGDVPVTYPNGANNVLLNLDQGTLGSRSNSQADALVKRAMALWDGVATASVNLSQGGDLSTDVTSSNVSTYLNNFSDGLNPVIYDTDGSIIDALYGVGAKNSILGFAGSAYVPSTATYKEGQAVINGYLSLSDARFVVVLAHELGHFIGLDHTQLDDSQGLSSNNYPLMYPTAYRTTESLHSDDVSAVSALYPNGTTTQDFGEIKGRFLQSSSPVLGANIWAKNQDTGAVYSSVSDYLTQNNGFFRMLVPAGRYTVHAESIATKFVGGSSVGPYAETSSDASFVAPHPIAPVAFKGSSASAVSLDIGGDCSAEIAFQLNGSGNVVNNDCGTTTAGADIVIDNNDTATSRTGSWTASSASGYWASNSLYNNAGSTFRWTPNVPSAGAYEVYVWWTYHSNRSTNVPYRVRHAGGTSTVTVNQRDPATAGRWVLMGTYNFNAGTGGYVEVSSENGQASADAVKFVPSSAPAPVDSPAPATASEVVVDNGSSNTTKTGTWATSSGANPWASNSVYNNSGNRFRWTPPLNASGRYQVYAWWTYHANRSSNVPYRVRHATGTATVYTNQHDPALGGKWVLLGIYDLDKSNAYVEVSSENGQASADAVRFTPAP